MRQNTKTTDNIQMEHQVLKAANANIDRFFASQKDCWRLEQVHSPKKQLSGIVAITSLGRKVKSFSKRFSIKKLTNYQNPRHFCF
jgi:hypothetical protein